MSEKHRYSCIVTIGNRSKLETEQQKDSFVKFMESFHVKDVVIKKQSAIEANDEYYYYCELIFENHNFIRVLRFSESLIAFSQFQGMSVHEFLLT